MKTYSWLVRREFWENRAIWIVPSVIGAALVLGALFGRVDVEDIVSPDAGHAVGGTVLFAFGVTFFIVMGIYSSWYLLDCLHADRKDRSVLFWKSLPISDTQTVLTKLFVGSIAIPVVYFLAADIASLLMAFVVSVRVRSSIGSAFWHADVWLQLQLLWLYVIVTCAIWYLPLAGWLMVVSAWAKRALILWATLPPLALYVCERWFLGSRYVGQVLIDRSVGYVPHAFRDFTNHTGWETTTIGHDAIKTPANIWQMINPGDFLSSPDTWIGAAVGAALIYAAIQLRTRRTDA
jgi:ABC-2 type transport system permease protein